MAYTYKRVDMALLDEILDAANLLCKFGQQLKEWGDETRNAVNRARNAGAPLTSSVTSSSAKATRTAPRP